MSRSRRTSLLAFLLLGRCAPTVELVATRCRFSWAWPRRPEWQDLSIFLKDGQIHPVNLRPLSVEQRGNLWRAIVRKAELRGKIQLPPPHHRR